MHNVDLEHQELRKAFGKALAIWLKRGGLVQRDLYIWGRETNSTYGPHSSQLSNLIRGKLDPRPLFFVGLGKANKAIAENDLAGCSREIKDRLANCPPYLNASGEPATVTDLIAQFIGEQPINEQYLTPETLTDEEISAILTRWQRAFRRHAKEMMLPPNEAWESLCDHLQLPSNQEQSLRDAFSGWGSLSVQQMESIQPHVEEAISAWGARL